MVHASQVSRPARGRKAPDEMTHSPPSPCLLMYKLTHLVYERCSGWGSVRSEERHQRPVEKDVAGLDDRLGLWAPRRVVGVDVQDRPVAIVAPVPREAGAARGQELVMLSYLVCDAPNHPPKASLTKRPISVRCVCRTKRSAPRTELEDNQNSLSYL